MKAKVINIISKEVTNSNAKYYVYKIIIDKPIDKLSDGRMIIDNTFSLTEYAARKYKSLNPYCSGRWSRTRPYKTLLIINKLKNFTKQIFTFLNRKLTIP